MRLLLGLWCLGGWVSNSSYMNARTQDFPTEHWIVPDNKCYLFCFLLVLMLWLIGVCLVMMYLNQKLCSLSHYSG